MATVETRAFVEICDGASCLGESSPQATADAARRFALSHGFTSDGDQILCASCTARLVAVAKAIKETP